MHANLFIRSDNSCVFSAITFLAVVFVDHHHHRVLLLEGCSIANDAFHMFTIVTVPESHLEFIQNNIIIDFSL